MLIESINDMFKNTVVLEVKNVFSLKSNIKMKCRLITSFHEEFSKVYRKEGGKKALELWVLTNKNRSWPSQKNIENSKIVKLLKDLKNKATSNESNTTSSSTSSSSSSFTATTTTTTSTKKRSIDHKEKEKEENSLSQNILLSEKQIQNGTLLVIKDPKLALFNASENNDILSKNIKVPKKKNLMIYNDLFIIFNI